MAIISAVRPLKAAPRARLRRAISSWCRKKRPTGSARSMGPCNSCRFICRTNPSKSGEAMIKKIAAVLAAVVFFSLPAVGAVKAIRFGKVWDGHKTIANAVVIVDGDKVQSVSENGKVPAGAEVIDLRHYTGIPGMIDSHTHVTYYWGGEPNTTPRRQPRRAV